jgi:Response regulators consisting of a CheY-like receiver domain and a winged-helix DNA-binding domain
MRCDDVRAALSSGFDGDGAWARAQVERHLVTCAGCRAFLWFLRNLEGQIGTLPDSDPPPRLAERIRNALPSANSGGGREGRKTMGHVLVVDDEPNIRRLAQVNLERHGYRVETAENGAQALAKIKANRPDLLVSDVMMPEMDGFELLANVRRDPAIADLPVIMLTAKAQDKDVMTGYQHGADMYLTKPFNPQELLQFVKRLLASQGEEDGGAYRI